MDVKKVTVYMPTAGRCELRAAVESVLDQNYPELELIIVNDSGSDLVNSGIDELMAQGANLRVIPNKFTKGACGARNTAIDVADGYFVTGIDDDDQMLPGRISSMVEAWEDQFALVFCGHIRRYADRDETVPVPSRTVSPDRILHRNIIGNQILTRTDYIRNAGMFDESLPAYQDFDMWVRLMRAYGSAKSVNLNNYVFTQTGNSRISSSKTRRRGAWLQFVRKHRSVMTTSQRQSLSLLLYKEQWKQPSLRRLVAFANCTNWRLVALLLRRRFLGR